MENPEHWQKVKKIVSSALEKLPEKRGTYLDEVCGSDGALRAEVESLLSAHETSHRLSEPSEETEVADGGQALRSIGPYRLLRKLGEGGMGKVWLAEQTAPVRRQVALKLIKAGMYDENVLKRFQLERQSLAIMNHPSIAKVFDAGATPEGQPYFVMEYVPGASITENCDKNKLDIPARLELFIQACEGVQHAHQKAIIHRDLKPENILVVEVDGKHLPRIIDFGLAKPMTPYLSGQSLNTRIGGFVGTPGYMSPEQADPTTPDVDTRCDVYSLGVVLYELLTGFLPFDSALWKKLPVDQVLRHLREEDPPRPSTKIVSAKASSSSSVVMRVTEPGQLARLLRGDLDWIAMKAIEKDRNRRYGTPSELAADLRRYLNHEPVLARPASTAYRLRKYVRRHRIGVAATATIVALLIASAIAQAVELRRITKERDRVNHERDRATRVTDFMTNMFKVSDPSQARGNTITAREILDKASTDIGAGLEKDPELQVHMMGVMGNVYQELGLYSQAQSLLEQAQEIGRHALGLGNPETIKAETSLAWVLSEEGHYADAEKVQREALENCRRAVGPQHSDTLGAMTTLGWILFLEGHYAEAEKIDRETLEARRRLLGPEHANTLAVMNNLAGVLSNEGNFAGAEKIDREILDIRRRNLGPEHPDTLKTLNNLAATLDEEGHYAESEKVNREILDIRRRVLGPEHPLTLTSMSNLADVLGDDGQYAEAEKIDRETLEARRRIMGPEHPLTLTSMDNLAYVLFHEDQYAEALKLATQARDIRRRVLGPDHPETALSTYTLACIALRHGQREEALSMLRESIDHGLSPKVALDMEKDPDLKPLQGDPRFAALVADARHRSTANNH